MGERERKVIPTYSGVFVARSQIMSEQDTMRAIKRISHEIIESNQGTEGLEIIGLQTGGVWLACKIAEHIFKSEKIELKVGLLDVAPYRDDLGIRPVVKEEVTVIPFDVEGKKIVLVDDVLFTGRTIRAALEAIHTLGRPAQIQLAVMVDRGHRELPIRPDFVGKNLPTRRDEVVNVTISGVEIGELVR